MIRFLQPGNWSPPQVTTRWTGNSRLIFPEVESAIETAWDRALQKPGVHLFDGPMCRLESWTATSQSLALTISKSSYKAFLGTNMANPDFARKYGSAVMANPVGVSPALVTRDGQLLLGRRTARVAYYPSRVHPFAGCMEPDDSGPFSAVHRELSEELSLLQSEINDLRCTGIAEDKNLNQPELIFAARTSLSRSQIESRLDPVEHQAMWSIDAAPKAIEQAVANDSDLTPVAVAALLLWGRIEFGQAWFDAIADGDQFR